MDIGTAKLRPPRGVEQWLTDIVRPNQRFTLQQYQRKALKAIRDIHRRGKLPILVGGTGLYIDAVVENWKIPKTPPSARVRRQLERELAEKGLPALVCRLREVDPASARRIDIKNSRRVIRALEVALTTGESFVSVKSKGKPLFRVIKIGIAVDRVTLRRRLQKRTVSMLRRGLLAETRRLLKNYSPDIPALSGIGYAEAAAYLQDDLTREQLIERIVTRSMQYARRQMTWWRRQHDIHWVSDGRRVSEIVRYWLENV